MTTLVAAGVWCRGDRVLLARRPAGKPMAGLWEFPGGKVEPQETPSEALARELHEELHLELVAARPLTFAVHVEPRRRICLLFYAVLCRGEPTPREDNPVAWVPLAELPSWSLPPADLPLAEALAAGRYAAEFAALTASDR